MFRSLKKYSTLCAIFVGITGCGKAIEESSDTNDVVQRDALTAPTISLNVDYSSDLADSAFMEYTIENSGWVKVPTSPFITKSLAETINTRIYINAKAVSSFADSNSQLFCDYTSVKIAESIEQGRDGYVHFFKGCKEDIDFDGIPDDVNYIPGELVAVDEANLIILEVNTSEQSGEVQVRSDIEVDWN